MVSGDVYNMAIATEYTFSGESGADGYRLRLMLKWLLSMVWGNFSNALIKPMVLNKYL
jgi:hypothetical protein